VKYPVLIFPFNTGYCFSKRLIVMDILKPFNGLLCPPYFHERIRRSISSLEITRPFLASYEEIMRQLAFERIVERGLEAVEIE
jgi:hypothetical protein